MKKLNFGIALAFGLVLCLTSCRDLSTSSKVIINEVMVSNESNAIDEYGENVPWIELFVKYYGPIDVAGYQLEAEQAGTTTRYDIPKGDVSTKVAPRQHIIFWADGNPNKGTSHTNFTLNPSQDVTIRLFNSNKDLIDEVKIPAGTLRTDQSYGRIDPNATERDASNWEVKDNTDGNADTYVTPGTANRVINTNAKQENFKTQDPSGVGMAMTAMTVVFSCLFLLFVSFKTVGIIALRMTKKNELKAKGMTDAQAAAEVAKSDLKKDTVPGEVYAAIGLALHEMQSDVHDIEEMVLTISHEDKPQDSPWSAKSLTMRQSPIRK